MPLPKTRKKRKRRTLSHGVLGATARRNELVRQALRWGISIPGLSTLSTIVGLVLFAIWAHDQIERLAPEIHPHDGVDTSSFVLPFTAKNRSLFDMNNVQFTCSVGLLYFMDAEHKTGILRDVTFATGTISVPRNSPINYGCNAAQFMRIRSDGFLQMEFPSGQFTTTDLSAFQPPIEILKMCLSISGRYRLFGVSIGFDTATFQWPAAPGQHQWIEGPIVDDSGDEKWIPDDSRLSGAWGLSMVVADETGQRRLLPGALKCGDVH